jgi:tight adherence protein B
VLRLLVDARRRVRDWSGRRTTLAALDRELVPLLEGLAATLRAGLTPARAFAHLATSGPSVDPLVDPLGDPVVDSLGGLRARLAAEAARGARLEPTWRAAAERSASPALLAVAEGWGLSERHGAPVVEVLDALVGALRDRMRTAAAVETALAAPRATARLLAVLPVGGVVLGELVGVHPLAVLVGSAAGRVAGVLGLAATLGGRLWMRRLVASVAGPT